MPLVAAPTTYVDDEIFSNPPGSGGGDGGGGEGPQPVVERADTNSTESLNFTFPEDTKLGSWDTANLIINRMVGTGIFSTPSTIIKGTRSVGWSMLLWVVGGAITWAGLFVYAELGMAIPRSGAEKLYVERIYRKPLYLLTCIVAIQTVFLSVSSANTINFTTHFRKAVEGNSSSCLVSSTPNLSGRQDWENKGISVVAITIVCLLHALLPKWGLRVIGFFSFFKLFTLLLVVICGIPALAGHLKIPRDKFKPQNFKSFDGIKVDDKDYSLAEVSQGGFTVAIMQVLWGYSGWADANRVLSEVDNPPRRFKRAIPIAVITVTTLYVLANIAYFAALSREDIAAAGDSVAVEFFIRIFGCNGASLNFIPLCVSFSALGNILAGAFANARVKQELAKEGILPFSRFFASAHPTNHSPIGGLFLHWIFTTIMILWPRSSDAYSFLTTLNTYSFSIVQLFVGLGFIYMKWYPSSSPPSADSRLYSWYQDVQNWALDVERAEALKAWGWSTVLWVVSLVYIVFVALIPYDNKKIGVFPSIQWWLIPVLGGGVLLCGIAYWVLWIHVLPRLGLGVEVDAEVLPDGSERLVYRRIRRGGHRAGSALWRQWGEQREQFRGEKAQRAMVAANQAMQTNASHGGGFSSGILVDGDHNGIVLEEVHAAHLKGPH